MTVTCLLSRPQIDLADNGFLRNLVLAVDKRNVNIYQFLGNIGHEQGILRHEQQRQVLVQEYWSFSVSYIRQYGSGNMPGAETG